MQAYEIAKAAGGVLFGSEKAEIKGISTDSRKIEKDSLFIAIRGERFDGNGFVEAAFDAGASVVIGNIEYAAPEGCAYIKVEDSVRALGLLAAHHRAKFSVPVVGITGSVGKTTTKEMIAAVLSTVYNTCKTAGNFNNDIGLPLTVLGMQEAHTAAVIEMGMSARGEISYLTKIAKPTAAVITNVGLSHIENLKTQENIRDAKLEIAEGLHEGGILFVNGDDPFLQNAKVDGVRIIRFGFVNPDCEIRGEITGDDSFRVDNTAFTVPVGGKHNLYNALAAYAVGTACGVPAEKAAKGILSYRPDGIRQSEVKIASGITVLCDYYNASPASMAVALEMLMKGDAKRRVAVIGDMLELGEIGPACHSEVGEKAAELGVDALFAVGPLSAHAKEAALKNGVQTALHFSDNAALTASLKDFMRAGDKILIKGSHGMKMEEIFEKIR